MEGNNSLKNGVFYRLMKTKESNIFLGLFGLCLILGIFTDTFLSSYNIGVVIRQVSFIALVALGQTLVLLTAGIDLSVGSIAGLSGILVSLFMSSDFFGMAAIIAVPLAMVCGLLMGLVNGLLIGKLRLNAFIVTLAFGEVWGGMILVITKGYPILKLPEGFTYLGQGMIGKIPMPVIIMLIIFAFMHYVLTKTPFGRNIYATGGNLTASTLAGIKVDKEICSVYMLSGLFSSIAGILMTSRMGAGQPTIGSSWVMPSVTAAIIGGTSMAGGEGTLIGTLIGAVFMGIISNGIVLLGISSYWERVITGLVVILAILLDFFRAKKK